MVEPSLGIPLGMNDSVADGNVVGCELGVIDGKTLGLPLGIADGVEDRIFVGEDDRISVGADDGDSVISGLSGVQMLHVSLQVCFDSVSVHTSSSFEQLVYFFFSPC